MHHNIAVIQVRDGALNVTFLVSDLYSLSRHVSDM